MVAVAAATAPFTVRSGTNVVSYISYIRPLFLLSAFILQKPQLRSALIDSSGERRHLSTVAGRHGILQPPPLRYRCNWRHHVERCPHAAYLSLCRYGVSPQPIAARTAAREAEAEEHMLACLPTSTTAPRWCGSRSPSMARARRCPRRHRSARAQARAAPGHG